jgi:hypothetical protein
MTPEQLLGQLSKREVAFHTWTNCFSCVYWRANKYAHWECTLPTNEETCRMRFENWMRKEIK